MSWTREIHRLEDVHELEPFDKILYLEREAMHDPSIRSIFIRVGLCEGHSVPLILDNVDRKKCLPEGCTKKIEEAWLVYNEYKRIRDDERVEAIVARFAGLVNRVAEEVKPPRSSGPIRKQLREAMEKITAGCILSDHFFQSTLDKLCYCDDGREIRNEMESLQKEYQTLVGEISGNPDFYYNYSV